MRKLIATMALTAALLTGGVAPAKAQSFYDVYWMCAWFYYGVYYTSEVFISLDNPTFWDAQSSTGMLCEYLATCTEQGCN